MGAVEKALVSSESSAMYAADEPRVLCLINDTVSNACKITLNLPKSTSCQYFLNAVARQIHMAPSAVEVFYEPAGRGEQVSVSNFLGQTMGDLCMGENRHNFFVALKDGVSQPPERSTSIVNEASAELVNIDNKEIYNSGDNYATNTAPQNPAYSINTSSYGYNSSLAKSDTGHVGLVNQAMTCYLNSLLQTLYMTPEFRNAVYRWEYCGSDEEAVKSIPYQLQRLFLLLQTSTKRAVETTDITKSFGWDSSEAWQQHDVQELCRVMFDALEKNWKDTDQANLITQLYQGKIKDYVKCLQCHSESARIDTFLDIPLVVRPFGSNTGYGSVEDALRAFVEHEILEGTNQYFCEKCNCKCNAHKGLKFLAFPYLLTLQLKRFDFDYSTMHRIKLNDRMSFPERLNLNEFVEAENEKEFLASSKESKAGDEAAGGDSPLIHSRPDPDEGVDEGIDIADCASGNIAPECTGASKNSVTNKPANVFEYELFSIMVHSGGASGGHYYAYIKSFQDGQWYSFNDQHVYRIVEDDIEKTFGGNSYGSNYYSYSSYSSSANAYMLMYRQVDTQRNKAFLLESEFPPHLLKQLNLLKNRDEEEQRKREIERNTCKIKLFHWDDLTKKYTESKLEVHRSKTLAEATYMAWKQLGLRNVMIIDFRLVRFDSSHEYIDSSIEDEWTTPFHQILGGVKSVYGFDLLAETKKRDQQFESYYSGDVMIRAIPVDVERETILEPLNIRLSPAKTIYDFKQVVADKLGIPTPDNIRCVIERYYNTLKPLDLGQKTLQSEGFQKTNKIFVSLSCSREEQRLAFEKTAMYHLLDRHQNTIRLIVHVPKMPVVAKVNVIASEENEDTQIEDNDSSVPLLMDAEEKSNPDMDEGIGESETDVISMADTAGDSATTSTMTVDQVESETGHTSTADPDCDPMNTGETSDNVVSSWHSVSDSNNDVGLDESSRTDLTSVHGDFVSAGIEFDESSSIKLPDYDNDNVGSVEFTSDMLTSHSLSQDSSSSRTVEVGEEIPSPSPLGDDEYSDRATPSPRTSPSPPITPPPVSPSPPAVSPSMEDSSMSTSFACDPPIMQSAIPNNSEEIDNSKDMANKKESNEYWDQELPDLRADDDLMTSVDQSRYFAVERTVFPLGYERTLYVHVDRRITLKGLKTFLESYVGTNTDNFRVFKFSQGGQEVEETRLSDSLVNYVHDTRVNIKYGRALKNGEQRIQIYQLVLNDAEPIKLLNEVVLAKGMTVGDAKTVIVEELRSEKILDISVNQCRLRRKCWKNPSHIYTDNSSTLEESVGNHLNSELLLEVLPESGEPLPVNHTHNELSIYVRRWWPSKFQIDGVQEIVTDNLVLENLLSKISEISGIEPENIFVAKGRGAFPCDLSVLEAEKDLEWNPNVLSIVQWPLSITDDGSVVFYKDRRETLQELTDEQRKQLQQKENTRLMKRVSPQPFSAKKERALKIYTDDRPSAAKPAKTMELSPPSPSLD